jgi:hypothetical protein
MVRTINHFNHFVFFFSIFLATGIPSSCYAEHPEIEKWVEGFADEVAAELNSKKVVVACRWIGKTPVYWRPHEAIATELTLALRKRHVDAIRYSSDHRIAKMADQKTVFDVDDVNEVKSNDHEVLLAAELSDIDGPQIKLRILDGTNENAAWEKTIEVPSQVLDIKQNIPELNKQIISYCQKNEGKCVGKGICSTLAKYALKEAKADQPGVYTWGRELDEREPILPGDILQLELVKFRGKGISKNYTHHTAVVTDVTPTHLVLHHQNVGPLGKVVQREEIPHAARRSGILQAYRPWYGTSLFPPLSPRRKVEPTIAQGDKLINLLKTIDPRLDSIKGIWFRDNGGLKWNRDTYARLQVPVIPPDEYVLRMRVKRLFGGDAIGIGVIVDGQPVQIVIDGYKGKISGLNMVDGKKCNKNSTTFKGAVLPENKNVKLEVRVTKTSVELVADGNTIIDWKGKPEQLSLQPEYEIPNKQWLFLTSYNTQFHVTLFTLEKTD